MISTPAHKRVHCLRKKNKILLEQLETHSSQIETALKTLKKTIRGKGVQNKSSPKIEAKCRAWTKRNNSLQVTQALCLGYNDMEDTSANSACSSNATGRIDTSSDQGTKGMIRKPIGISNKVERSQPVFNAECQYLEKRDGTNSINKNSQSTQEILSLIDYSPKSTFLRKMKSRSVCESCFNDVNMRSNFVKNSSNPLELCYKCFKDRRKRKLTTSGVNSPATSETSTSTGHRKELERSVDDYSMSKQHRKCNCSEEDSNLERLKKFRDSNWVDCHADDLAFCSNEKMGSKGNPFSSFLSPEQHKCKERYQINNRLFAVPLDSNYDKFVYCPSCQDEKTQKSHGAIPKQVIVSVPTSLMEACGSPASYRGGKLKCLGNGENRPISSVLAKKLFRKPKPHNSMALRYQKGVS